MMTITTIILIIAFGFFIARQVLKKSKGNSSVDKFVALPLTVTNRLFYYALLAGLSIVTPYILTMIFIIVTGDRYDGMKLSVIPGLATVHLVFGLLFIKKKLLQKILLTIVITAIAFGLVWLGLTNNIIKTNWDIYQFWDIAVTNFLAGLIIWETYFQIDSKLKSTTN
jgi:Zn-dependent protease with chaperone function